MALLRNGAAIVALWAITVLPRVNAQGKTPYDYVDPLIGTINGGHVFPGATLPFGMAKAGPDVYGENQGGFASDDSPIWGYSHMHDSGTGGSASLGNFPIFAHAGCPNDDINACGYTSWERMIPRVQGSVVARPGYFAITLENQVRAEMTVTNKTALYRFTFPEVPTTPNTTLSPLILLELSDLPKTRTDGNITVMTSGDTGRMTGHGRFEPSFGQGKYQSYFCADFIGAPMKDAGVFLNSRAGFTKTISVFSEGNRASRRPAGGWIKFGKPDRNNQILVRVGMSFKSEEQACANAKKEIPNSNFDSVVKSAEDAWKEKLSVITIKPGGASEVIQKAFWSGVYRTMISPQDYTGENPFWDSGEPYYDSFYCIWDSFRSIHPLLTLLDPHSQTLMVRSLLDIYQHEGKLPDCRMSFCKGFTQGGSNADVVIADAYFKNISAGVDWKVAYEALISDAEVEPLNWDIEGRGGLESWKSLGYIPTENYDTLGVGTETRSISRTVEYAYNDFVIALLAREFGHMDDYRKYLGRSGNWKNMYKADQRSAINGVDTGFVGFLQPKYMNGTWGYQDPIFCSPLLSFDQCYLNPSGHETYEGSCWMYTFYVPGDMATLVQTLGGPREFVRRLDFLHESGVLYIGDEQAFLKVFLYHYAGRPAKSAERAHFYIPSQFNDTLGGIPGNDDSGAMGSFAALTMMGIFPNAGQDVYFITPPFFESVSIRNGQSGKTATIKNINFDPTGKNVYIQSATLDGKPYTRNWLQHKFFLDGGTLELTLGSNESTWGTRPEDLPPSLGPFGNGTTPGVNASAVGKDKRWHMPKLDLSLSGSWGMAV
ncbi:glycoside hydrolase family 92 protein [Aaosphaeria arxii CBS 175.79]|uniref:Glycoside hydrolase family 92 protein n=1 Tax=Aaosphaeria arxii CBS 175.79 TaxID=1450172 RepID=A0A6A5Y719_9PLEO|nr:glycoside hydrolase family 92 protein [Aaosphaeria arxii CBS 175.79]KAF2021089.1 glycoside hydrolase family 92 protein [Aaosphaeria arxii CBS 175.79]